jgi:hypothetical protein
MSNSVRNIPALFFCVSPYVLRLTFYALRLTSHVSRLTPHVSRFKIERIRLHEYIQVQTGRVYSVP